MGCFAAFDSCVTPCLSTHTSRLVVTPHTSVTPYTSHLTAHTSVTPYTSHLVPHTLHATPHCTHATPHCTHATPHCTYAHDHPQPHPYTHTHKKSREAQRTKLEEVDVVKEGGSHAASHASHLVHLGVTPQDGSTSQVRTHRAKRYIEREREAGTIGPGLPHHASTSTLVPQQEREVFHAPAPPHCRTLVVPHCLTLLVPRPDTAPGRGHLTAWGGGGGCVSGEGVTARVPTSASVQLKPHP